MSLAFWNAELLKNSWPCKIVCLLEIKIVETNIGFIMRFAFWTAELLKIIGFIRFLGRWKAELLKNHWFYNVFGSLEGNIVEKPLVL